MASHRDGLGKAFQVLGNEYPNLIVLSPDVAPSTQAIKFQAAFPERYINTGISEMNTIGMAAGFSTSGWIPLIAGYAMFIAGKAWEPIRNSVAYPHLNVKIVATHAGINVGQDGVTHQAIEDIALMRVIPGMTVLAPTDANQVLPVLRAALDMKGPVYVRLEREAMPMVTDPDARYKIGTSLTLRSGDDAAVIAVGSMAVMALKAAEILEQEGIQLRVISMVSIKPIDIDAIIKAAAETGCIITAEDHNQYGGLGGAVAEILARLAPTPLEQVSIKDTFAESGKPSDLQKKYNITTDNILSVVRQMIQRHKPKIKPAGKS